MAFYYMINTKNVVSGPINLHRKYAEIEMIIPTNSVKKYYSFMLIVSQ